MPRTKKKKPDADAPPPPPVNGLAAALAAREEANAQAHAELLQRQLAAVADKRMALAAEPAVPPEKCPL